MSPTYHQRLKRTYYHNTWTQGWLGSHVLSPQAEHRIFFIFHSQKVHIEHDNHLIETNIVKMVHAQIEVNEKYPF